MDPVHLEVDASGVANIRFARPDVLNAIDLASARALHAHVRALATESQIRCVLLSGEGRAFVAGGDLVPFLENFDQASAVVDEVLNELHPAIEGLRALDAPVIAAVHGVVAGAGLSLMAGCDLVLAAEGTRFVIAFNRIGVSPDCGATYFLPRLIGPRRTAEFYLLGPTLSAERAAEIGLINRVLPANELEGAARRCAADVAAGPTRAFGHFKRLLQQSFGASLGEQLEAEREAVKAATRTDDFRSGITAFAAKKVPQFHGR